MTGNDQATTEHLTPKQELLIECLLAGHNITSSAKLAGIGDKTARRWLKNEDFQRGYRAAQRAMFDQALTGLMMRTERAIETIGSLMDSEETPAHTRLNAAKTIVEQAITVYKTSEIEAKMQELEALLKQKV